MCLPITLFGLITATVNTGPVPDAVICTRLNRDGRQTGGRPREAHRHGGRVVLTNAPEASLRAAHPHRLAVGRGPSTSPQLATVATLLP